MSEPSYRIDLKYEPQYAIINDRVWSAYVTRLSDDELVAVGCGETALEAGSAAREKIRTLADADATTALMQPIYVDEDGNLTAAPSAPEPQSLRA